MNETLKKFGYPETLVREFERWAVVLRPKQVTLGSLVLVCKEPVTALGAVSRNGFSELAEVTRQVEDTLQRTFHYDKINYLLLMMVDPDVHFHVLPRYAEPRRFRDVEFTDASWPGPPDLAAVNATSPETSRAILERLRKDWR
jgi:diadenosine tetraphosphate (Ap4A) HIT family hydrolase